ncbi:MAG: ABC transporter substrate-binding protein [Leptolyngbya sp. IPPAS B-1204]|nr:spermidine/putrescine ABC transporter substrate-binding protein [Elainella sp. C42_A2020_010]RNJ69202.1 MAG: spermidine/putrescine ABC transporter substrate-binding protein [Leptolyngbya sp. IPPAS B-1204]
MKRRLFLLILCLTVALSIVGLPQLQAQQLATTELNIYNWDTYIAPEVLEEFEQRYQVKINYDTYGSNEEMYARIKASDTHYDLIFPADYMIQMMATEGLLQPLNASQIPNLKHIDPNFLNPDYDPGNRYSVPYQWGTLGIGYNLETTGKEIDSWTAMFMPQYAGRIAWMDDTRYTIGAVLLFLGYDPNTEKVEEINQARDFLIQQKDTIAAFADDIGQSLLNQGEVDLAFEWSGDIFQVMKENPDLRYAIPKEGSIIWTDNMAIPSQARHRQLAEQFINFILEPTISARISNFTQYGSPNRTARQAGLINPSDLGNPGIYPPAELFAKLKHLKHVGESSRLYEAAWDAIKTSSPSPST